VWPGEARDFTPWMADNIEVLGDHLGFGDLSLVAIEVPIPGGRNLDALAEDSDGRKWAIENQYGMGDHDHLTRGLDYAVALECHALVIVAEGHREEFVAVADEWNRYSEAYGSNGIQTAIGPQRVEGRGQIQCREDRSTSRPQRRQPRVLVPVPPAPRRAKQTISFDSTQDGPIHRCGLGFVPPTDLGEKGCLPCAASNRHR